MAFTTRTPTRVWHARETDVVIALSSAISIGSTSSLYSIFDLAGGTKISALMKNVTIAPPGSDYEKIDTMGVDTNSFQNAIFQAKPFGVATVSGTLILDEDETLDPFLDTSATAISPGTPEGSRVYSRYQVGDGFIPQVSILVNLISGTTGRVTFVLDKARITKFGDLKLGGTDGTWEQDISVVCLPANYYWEIQD